MDSPKLRKQLNKYLSVEIPYEGFDWDESKISESWPWELEYKGCWVIPNDNDMNDTVDIYAYFSGVATKI